MVYTQNFKQVQDARPIDQSKVNELLLRSQLNWKVETQPLCLSNGQQTPFLGVVRKDNHHCFQSVSKGYVPLQNDEFMKVVVAIAEMTQAEIEVVKSLSSGAITYASIKGQTRKIEGMKVGDTIGEKMTIVNSHDGSKSFGIGFGHVVLSCTNGMTRFDRKGFISIRHTASMKAKLQGVFSGWKRIKKESNYMLDRYQYLMDKNISNQEIQKVIEIVTNVKADDPANELSTRKKNILKSLWGSLGSEMSYKGQTAWGLLNGVTHYTTQLAGKNESGLKSKMFGGNAKHDLNVWNYLNSL